MALRDVILGKMDFDLVEVEVPEWGVRVFVRGVTAAERVRTMKMSKELDAGKLDIDVYQATVLSWCLCDADGAAIFTQDDVKKLAGKNAGVLDRLFQKVSEASGVSDQEQAELEKNLETTLSI